MQCLFRASIILNIMTNEEKVAKINELQLQVFGTLEEIRDLMTSEVMKHCEQTLERTNHDDTDCLHVVSLREDLQEYSKLVPML